MCGAPSTLRRRAPAAAAHLCLTTRRVAAFHFPRRTLAASTVAAAARKEVFTAQEAQELLKQGYTCERVDLAKLIND